MKHIAALGLAMIVSAIIVGFVAQARELSGAWTTSFAAAALIFAVESIAILIIARAPAGPSRLTATMLGMLLRMVVALGAVVLFHRTTLVIAGQDVGSTLVALVAVHYLVGLIVGTWMCVRLVALQDAVTSSAGRPSPPPVAATA